MPYSEMGKKILLLRTYRPAGIGGPLPPLELLYISSMIMKAFGDRYRLKVLDMGIGNLSLEEVRAGVEDYLPEIICLNTLAWEADLAHDIAALCKKLNKDTIIIIQGELATLAGGYLLDDVNIDYLIAGEAEITIIQLLGSMEEKRGLSKVDGIIYRSEGRVISTRPRAYIENLDEIGISSQAWDLIDVREYAKYSNWNGSLKEEFYIPILTSRGCPFDCTFCCNRDIYGRPFRSRSPENVLAEIKFLHEKYGVKEIHIFDAVFNYDTERAKQICALIIDSGMKLSLAFPRGVRADIMTGELIGLLKKTGTYKLTYGIETAAPRLQKMIRKNLDIEQVRDIIRMTSRAGIIVGGYFMLGFPTETLEEMEKTVDFAVNSDLDLAAFFKVTLYDDILKLYRSKLTSTETDEGLSYGFEDLGYYSRKRSYAEIPVSELNRVILNAQQRFYLKAKRIWRGLSKFPRRRMFLGNLVRALGLMLQAYLARELLNSKFKKQGTR